MFFSPRKRQISLYFLFVSPWLNHCSDRLENLLQNPVLRSVKFCCCFWLFRYTCYKLLASYEQEMPLSLEFFSNYLRFYFSSLFGNENPFRLFIHAFLVHRQVRRFLCTITFWLPSLKVFSLLTWFSRLIFRACQCLKFPLNKTLRNFQFHSTQTIKLLNF